jgi:hypothetical protein
MARPSATTVQGSLTAFDDKTGGCLPPWGLTSETAFCLVLQSVKSPDEFILRRVLNPWQLNSVCTCRPLDLVLGSQAKLESTDSP